MIYKKKKRDVQRWSGRLKILILHFGTEKTTSRFDRPTDRRLSDCILSPAKSLHRNKLIRKVGLTILIMLAVVSLPDYCVNCDYFYADYSGRSGG